jgi:hypothetical protein
VAQRNDRAGIVVPGREDPAPARPSRARQVGVALGLVAFLLAVVGGWYLYSVWAAGISLGAGVAATDSTVRSIDRALQVRLDPEGATREAAAAKAALAAIPAARARLVAVEREARSVRKRLIWRDVRRAMIAERAAATRIALLDASVPLLSAVTTAAAGETPLRAGVRAVRDSGRLAGKAAQAADKGGTGNLERALSLGEDARTQVALARSRFQEAGAVVPGLDVKPLLAYADARDAALDALRAMVAARLRGSGAYALEARFNELDLVAASLSSSLATNDEALLLTAYRKVIGHRQAAYDALRAKEAAERDRLREATGR